MEAGSDKTNDEMSASSPLCDISQSKGSVEPSIHDEDNDTTSPASTTDSDSAQGSSQDSPESSSVSRDSITVITEESSSGSYQSTHFDCESIFDLDGVGPCSLTSDLSDIGSSRSSLHSDFHFSTEPGLGWKSFGFDNNFYQDSIPRPNPCDSLTTEYHQTRFQNWDYNRSRTNKQQTVKEEHFTKDTNQQCAPLRIPELQSADQSCQRGSETNVCHKDSPLNFLSGILSCIDMTKDAPVTHQIDFDTEFSFSTGGYISPTEFLNKPYLETSRGQRSSGSGEQCDESQSCLPDSSGCPEISPEGNACTSTVSSFLPYPAHLSPVSDACEENTAASDSNDSDTSIINPLSIPPNTVTQASSTTSDQWYHTDVSKDIPLPTHPPPPVPFGYQNQRPSCTYSSCGAYPHSSDCLPSVSSIGRTTYQAGQLLYPSNPGSANNLGTGVSSQHSLYNGYHYANRYMDSSTPIHSLDSVDRYTCSNNPVFVDETMDRDQIKLVPISEDVLYPNVYPCPIDWCARNSSRYTAIQPLSKDSSHLQRLCEQNMNCNVRIRKRGAVSIKTKEGKFLCTASDVQTRTVRELLDSAETCKASTPSTKEDYENVQDNECESDNTPSSSGLSEGQNATVTNSEEEILQSLPKSDTPNEISSMDDTQVNIVESSEDSQRLSRNVPSPVDFSSIPNLASSRNSKNIQGDAGELDQRHVSSDHSTNSVITHVTEERGTNAVAYVSPLDTPTTSVSTSASEARVFTPLTNIQSSYSTTAYDNWQYQAQNHLLDSGRALPSFQSVPWQGHMYRGPVMYSGQNRQYVPQQLDSNQHFGPPAETFPHLMFNPGGGNYYGPILPPREVQLRTAQPYPLLPLPPNAQPFTPTSQPFVVPHASSYQPDVTTYATSHFPVNVGKATCMQQSFFASDNSTTTLAVQHTALQQTTCTDRDTEPACAPSSTAVFSVEPVNSSLPSPGIPSASKINYVFSEALQQKRKQMKKSQFKPRHFELYSLEIGNFKLALNIFKEPVNTADISLFRSFFCKESGKTAKIKVIFSKKKLLYEFQLNDMEEVYATHCRKLASIEVLFSSIVCLAGEGKKLKLEVDVPPKVYRGEQLMKKASKFSSLTNAKYDRKKESDMTAGEIHHAPYHYISLKAHSVEKIKHQLELFDSKFELLLREPFVEQPGKCLKQTTNDLIPIPKVKKLRSAEVLKHPSPNILKKRNLPVPQTRCHCSTGCRSTRCSCTKQLRPCGTMCHCKDCKNCFNMLMNAKIDFQEAKADTCLFQNINKIMNLEEFLDEEIVLPCCGERVLLSRCIPGEVTCPNYPRCRGRYKYSWCLEVLCDQLTNPRNHCKICRSCCGQKCRHCGSCNRCYFAGGCGFTCPNCNAPGPKISDRKTCHSLSDADMIRNMLPI